MIRFLKETAEWPSLRQLLAATLILFCLLLSIWTFALWYTGAKFRYRSDNDSGLVALYLAPEAGVSIL